MIEPLVSERTTAYLKKAEASTDEAKERAAKERRRYFEVRANFYDRLSALDAGSIAVIVSVGIAVFGRLQNSLILIKPYISLLAVVVFLFWLSLICAIGHNFLFVRIASLEAEHADPWSDYLALISVRAQAEAIAYSEMSDILQKEFVGSFHGRVQALAMNLHRTNQSITHIRFLGSTSVAAFSLAYTLVMFCVVRLWWITGK